MEALTPYLSFALVSLMIAISPGPSWAYTVSTTLGHGRSSGMVGNLGNSSGIVLHAVAATLGLSAIISYSSFAFQVLKLLGAIYLVYLGLQAFRGRGLFAPRADRRARTSWQLYRDGVLVNLLNPKMVLLFVALLPQFVQQNNANPMLQIAIMGLMHAVIAFAVHSTIVVFSNAISSRVGASRQMQQLSRYVMGAFFVAFGARMALFDRA